MNSLINRAFIVLPVHLYKDITTIRKYKSVHLYEENTFFTKFRYHKLKLTYHRATLNYYYKYL